MKLVSKPLLYRIIRLIVKTAMAVFFQKIEVRHGEYIPDQGAVIFVANHPNSIMDALVMGVVTKRKVNYIGHAGLFSNKLKSWFLRSCGVIPVYRREDAPDKMEQNISTFAACYDVLEKGESIGIFPEGTSDMLRKVKQVKTGAARIVLEAERRNGYQLGLKLIPIGLYFFSRSRFRSKVLLNVGEPIDLAQFLELNQHDNHQAVEKLTSEIQSSLERLTVNIRHEELDEFVHDIENLYREELKIESGLIQKASKATIAEFFLTQKIAECVDYYYEHDRELVYKLQEKVASYKRKLQHLHLKDEMLREKTSFTKLIRRSLLNLFAAVLGFPFALYGMLNNFIPYFMTEYLAKKFIDDRTKILSALLIGGVLSFVFFYAIQAFWVWHFGKKFWASLYLISLPLSGLLALAYLKALRQEQERLSLSFFVFTNRQLFNKMRRERKILMTELNKIKDEYLKIMSISVTPDKTVRA